MASSDDIARAFLTELGAPITAPMLKAVTAWLRAESGSTVRAGNPWNISLPAANEIASKGGPRPISYWQSSSGQKFAVYADSLTGARAAARLLMGAGSDWRGYDKIVSAAKSSDPIRFLKALAASAWDAGRYGTLNGGTNKLIGIYTNLGGGEIFSDQGHAPESTTPSLLDNLGAIVGNILDPSFWLRILALIFGGLLFLFGGVNVVRATAS